MTQQKSPSPKTLGKSSGSLNAPIAAFTMAIVLCSYCFSSIRTARREAQIPNKPGSSSNQRAALSEKNESSWVGQALEESRAERDRKGSR